MKDETVVNRILFEPCEVVDGRVEFGGARAEHVMTVLHGEVGQTLKTGVLDGAVGTSVIEAVASAPDAAGWRVTVRCDHRETAPASWFDLLLAPPRPRAMKRLLPQLAALGVGKIVLVGAQKVEKAFWGAQLMKEEVYRPLLVEGLMQCGAAAVPVIRAERNFRSYARERLADEFPGSRLVVAHPGPAVASASDDARRPLLAIGPEGGWTDEEVSLLESLGFARMALGPRILRTDTAAIALIARLMR